MKINQIIINELSEGAQPGVATTTAQTPQAQAAAQAIQKGLEKLQQQSPGLDHSFNTTTAIQEILPDGTVVMDSNLQPSALQNVRKILALGGGANFKVSMSYQGIPSAANMSTVPPAQPQPGVAEGDVPFRGVGGAFKRGDNERHDLDPTDWYIVKDGEMFSASIYPRQVQQAISQGFSRTRAEAKARVDSQGVAEDDSALQAFLNKGGNVQQLPYKKPRKADKTDYGSRHIGGCGDKMKASRTGTAARTQGNKVAGIGEAFDLDDLRKAAASSRSPEDTQALKRNPDFGKLMQKSVNKHNKAVVKTKQDIGSRVADIGAGGKEYNVKTDAAWDAAKKKVSEGSKQ